MRDEPISGDIIDRNIKLIIEYDGSQFSGWQWQPNVRTVQGELQSSLKKILQQNIKLIGSGRTDVGVHALGQVANFHTGKALDIENIVNGVNSTTGWDVQILHAEEVDSSFHSRYDAKLRYYRYVISKQRKAIGRQYAWVFEQKLDIEAIHKGSTYFLGEHDFKSFCQTQTDATNFISNVYSLEWQENDQKIVMEICANRFLHNMVRVIVGTLIEVGRNKIDPENIQKILLAQDRFAAGMTAPAQGLFLVRIEY